jgi:hypothetical protein
MVQPFNTSSGAFSPEWRANGEWAGTGPPYQHSHIADGDLMIAFCIRPDSVPPTSAPGFRGVRIVRSVPCDAAECRIVPDSADGCRG